MKCWAERLLVNVDVWKFLLQTNERRLIDVGSAQADVLKRRQALQWFNRGICETNALEANARYTREVFIEKNSDQLARAVLVFKNRTPAVINRTAKFDDSRDRRSLFLRSN